MKTLERPGINEKWLKSWKSTAKSINAWIQKHDANNIAALEYFVDHGKSLVAEAVKELVDAVTPPVRAWESIGTYLETYSAMRLAEWEMVGINEQRWDSNLVATVFSAYHLAQMRALYTHMLHPLRYPGKSLQRLAISDFPFTALGFIDSRYEAVERLAKLQIAAFRKQYFSRSLTGPISAFLARLLADYLGEPPVIVRGDPEHLFKGEIPADPVMAGLFDVWRESDANAILPHCLAACDIHTHHAITGANSHRREFAHCKWTHIPIAVLFVFKLRSLLGLRNPEVDHPLMNSVLGRLPTETKGKTDELIERVHARMIQDGFNEQEIWDGYFTKA